MNKGGRTSTTWEKGSNWCSGATTTIRVPIALVPKVMKYAREIDAGVDPILNAIDQYIEMKRQNYQPNQYSKELMDINTRAWDELRKFRKLVETSCGKPDNTNAAPQNHLLDD